MSFTLEQNSQVRSGNEIITFMREIKKVVTENFKSISDEDLNNMNKSREYAIYCDTYALTVEFIRNGRTNN